LVGFPGQGGKGWKSDPEGGEKVGGPVQLREKEDRYSEALKS